MRALLFIGGAAALYAHTRGYRVQFKEGVITAWAPEFARALPSIERAHQDANIGRGAIITSGTDGQHMKGSLHYVGRAADLRSNDLATSQKSRLVEALRARLGRDFDVVPEPTHIHVEYDPKTK